MGQHLVGGCSHQCCSSRLHPRACSVLCIYLSIYHCLEAAGECTSSKCADAKLGGVAESLEGKEVLQRNLADWIEQSLMG